MGGLSFNMLEEQDDSSLKEKLIESNASTDQKKLTKPQLVLRWPMLLLICLLMVCDMPTIIVVTQHLCFLFLLFVF